MEENKEVFIPEPLSEALYNPKLTQKQRKFVLLLVHSEGLKSASQCAIEAGYSKKVLESWHPVFRTLNIIL